MIDSDELVELLQKHLKLTIKATNEYEEVGGGKSYEVEISWKTGEYDKYREEKIISITTEYLTL